MLKNNSIHIRICWLWVACLLLMTTSSQAADNVLEKIEFKSPKKNSTQLDFISQAPPNFEIIENLKKKIYIIKFRDTNLGDIHELVVFQNSILDGFRIKQIEENEFWVLIKAGYDDLKVKIGKRKVDSKTLSISFYRLVKKESDLAGIEITAVQRELSPRSEAIIVYSKKPIQYDVSRDRSKPGKFMKVRLLNARLAKFLIVPDAETDILQSLKFEKRGKYLNMMLAPKKYVLNISVTKGQSPIRLILKVSEDKRELVTDADINEEEIEKKKEEENKEKLEKEQFMTQLFDEAEKFYKLGRFENAALMFKNIFNYSPYSDIGIRARFRSADSFYQYQKKEKEKNGEHFVIKEYKSAINDSIVADKGYENIPRAYYNIGLNYLALKFYEDAYNQFEIILKKYPESPFSKRSVFHQGVIHLNMERYEKAIESLQKFVEENIQSRRIHAAYYKIGESQFQLKQYKEAKKNFDRAWSLNAEYMMKDAELMFHMGEAYFENQDYNTARSLYEKLIDLYPRETFSNLVAIRIGDFLREEDKDDNAIKAYEKAINEYPKELSLIGKMRIANILAEKPTEAEYKKALAIYDMIITKYFNSDQLEEAMLRKALTLSLFHHYPEAVAELEGFCREFPKNIYVKNNIIHDRILETITSYIEHYYNRGAYLDVLGVFEQFEKKYYRRPQYSACFPRKSNQNLKQAAKELVKKAPLFEIADAYYRLGLYDKALQYYEIILKEPENPLSSLVFFNKGKIFDSKEEPEKAQQIFMEFISQYPEHVFTPQVKKTLGDSYFKVHKSDRVSRAIRIYKQTIRDYEDSDNVLEREIIPSCWFALGTLYQGIGRYDDSIGAYRNVLRSYEHPLQSEFVDEIVVETYFILGNLYRELNQLPEAMETYNEAIRLFPKSEKTPWAKYHKGEIFVKYNQKDKALLIFEDLMKEAKDHPDALWGPMAREIHRSILNELKFDKYLKRSPEKAEG